MQCWKVVQDPRSQKVMLGVFIGSFFVLGILLSLLQAVFSWSEQGTLLAGVVLAVLVIVVCARVLFGSQGQVCVDTNTLVLRRTIPPKVTVSLDQAQIEAFGLLSRSRELTDTLSGMALKISSGSSTIIVAAQSSQLLQEAEDNNLQTLRSPISAVVSAEDFSALRQVLTR